MFKQILTVLLSAFVIDAHDFNICHSTNSINLKSIQLNPDPPVAGKNLKVTLQGTSPQDISSPTANLQFSVLGIPVSARISLNQPSNKLEAQSGDLINSGARRISLERCLNRTKPSGILRV